MAKTHTLKAEDRKRTGTGMLKRMRREGFIPSVVYGGGSDNRNVKISAKDFRDMIATSASANVLVDLELVHSELHRGRPRTCKFTSPQLYGLGKLTLVQNK